MEIGFGLELGFWILLRLDLGPSKPPFPSYGGRFSVLFLKFEKLESILLLAIALPFEWSTGL